MLTRNDWLAEFTAWRRDFHAHPELGYQEHRTASLVAARLESFGLAVTTGLAGTGVVGTLRNGSSDRAIAIRADMDALPMQEENDFGHHSLNRGIMHACGHDGHTTMLLAAARHLAATRNFDGTVHFIFQPAEEGGAGAKRMIEAGLFERFPCQSVFGAYNDPNLDVGIISASPGTVNAASDTVSVRIKGRGGHAARPHQAVDPVLAGSQIVLALQSIASRRISPLDSVVVSICRFHAGTAHNVIPQEAELEGTVRTLTAPVQDLVAEEIPLLIGNVARAAGAEAETSYARGYPPVVNDAATAARAACAAASVVGEAGVRQDLPASMGGEDFAYYALERPSCFLRIGQRGRDENGELRGHMPLHHQNYDFNDDILPIGAALWVAVAEQELSA
ncbi:MAG TPA: M20 aminoacylase family protein [Acetobacteraceae bacterium]|nr:M20 aminoacylase family protein [Acetobacteraceae bacterium]